jgi:hypothetical protein
MTRFIDLHIHSTFSDGSCTPTQLVLMAKAINLAAIAVTDHDTCDGVGELLEAGRQEGVETLSGIELSIEAKGRSIHLLGYGFDPNNAALREALEAVRGGRNERNERIVRKLQMLGYSIRMDEVRQAAGEDVVGRPHIAKVLLDKKIVGTGEEAFDRFLARGAAAYCERLRLEPAAAMNLIRQAGGIPVMAHPYFARFESPDALVATIERLKDMGLGGIEAYYSEHTDDETKLYIELAKRFDLVVTGGTDFHGLIRPGVMLGRGRGTLRVPYSVFERLKQALNQL